MLQNYKTASLSKIKSEFKGMQEINETRPNKGCGSKSAYLQILVILWKYTEFASAPFSIIDKIVSNNGYRGKMPYANSNLEMRSFLKI